MTAAKSRTAGKRKVMKKKSTSKQQARTRVPPVAIQRETDAYAMPIGQNREAVIAVEGPASIDVEDMEIVDGPKLGDKAEIEAFMAEKLTVLVQPATERNAENPIPLGVNGRMCYVFRNQPSVMKRCYVQQLAKAKAENFDQDPANPDPDIANKMHGSHALKYPFSVIHDPNPNGHAWLQKALAEE